MIKRGYSFALIFIVVSLLFNIILTGAYSENEEKNRAKRRSRLGAPRANIFPNKENEPPEFSAAAVSATSCSAAGSAGRGAV